MPKFDGVNCSTCKHSRLESRPGAVSRRRFCRLNPPAMVAVLTPKGTELLAQVPQVDEGDVCSHYEPLGGAQSPGAFS